MHEDGDARALTEGLSQTKVKPLVAHNYSEITDILPHIVWMTHPGGGTMYLNRRWTEYTGFGLEQTIEHGWNWFLHPEDVPAAESAGKEAERTGERYEVEFRIRSKEGAYRWFLSRGVPVKGAYGRIIWWTGTCTDIDEQKQNEQAQRLLATLHQKTRLLGEPEEVLRRAVYLVGEFLQVSRCNYADVDVAGQMARFHEGYGVDGPSYGYAFPLEGVGAEIVFRLAQGQTVVVENTRLDPRTFEEYLPNYMPDQIEAYIAVPILKNGLWVAVLGVHSDVPRVWKPEEVRLLETVAEQTWMARENAQLYQKMRAAGQRTAEAYAVLDTLLKTAPVGFALFDTELRVVRINDSLATLSGASAPAHLGKTVLEVLPTLSEQVMPSLRQVVETGEPEMDHELAGEAPGALGEERFWLASYYPVRDPQEILLGIGMTVVEITERKRYEAHIEALYARIQRAVTETHHRVKNNLQLMAAMVDMRLMEEVQVFTPDELRQLGIHIRTLALVHDLLTQETKEGEQFVSLPIKKLLQRLLTLLEQTTANRKIRSHLEEATLSSKQSTSLAIVLNELISNALKHGKRDIDVLFTVQGSECELVVQDDGPGFPADFDPVYSTNTGLELVRNLANLDLSGGVRFLNRPEGGAKVIVAFPLNNYRPALVTG